MLRHSELPQRVGEVMEMVNADFSERFAQKTWAEWRPILAEHDVWSCPCNMPDEVRSYHQANEIGIFRRKGEIAFPITLYGYPDAEH
jgi:crotonobetainyl-CoA:carnitine CoA-transferase CaiB-like acyl-CoA transferase